METEKILREFNKNNVNYCVLRNYENSFKGNEDIDILIDYKDGFNVKNILKKFGKTRKIFGVGPHLIGDKFFDIKVGCIDYGGYCLKPAKLVLSKKRKNNYFYILDKEDELLHLILKSLSGKASSKKYLKKIKTLMESADTKKVKKELTKYLGETGKKLFELIEKERYGEAMKIKHDVLKKSKSIRRKLAFLFYRSCFPLFKR